ncbi:hypothetical protein VPHD69_0192 [Vibrio phage D69]
MKALTTLGISLAVSAAVSTIALKVGHSRGKKEAINNLREEQLSQAHDEYSSKLNSFKGSLDEFSEHRDRLDSWLAEEERTINEMYDEIINNL